MDKAPKDQAWVNLLKSHYVVKVKNFNGRFRVFILSKSKKLDYEDFKDNVFSRRVFGPGKRDITFIDKEGDVVTIGNDEELGYALVHLSINPLKVMFA